MKLNSKLFDNIRVKPRRGQKQRPEHPECDWQGCSEPGTYKAPRAERTGGFHHFCLKHVRQYNQSFNYFAENEDDDLDDAMNRSERTGQQSTWGMGANPHGRTGPRPHQHRTRDFSGRKFSDPHNLFARLARNQGRNPIKEREKRVLEADRRALETLGLEGKHESADIKAAYKALVKKHHPDANGGDRSSEDRLRAIIAAYTHLKQKGFV